MKIIFNECLSVVCIFLIVSLCVFLTRTRNQFLRQRLDYYYRESSISKPLFSIENEVIKVWGMMMKMNYFHVKWKSFVNFPICSLIWSIVFSDHTINGAKRASIRILKPFVFFYRASVFSFTSLCLDKFVTFRRVNCRMSFLHVNNPSWVHITFTPLWFEYYKWVEK